MKQKYCPFTNCGDSEADKCADWCPLYSPSEGESGGQCAFMRLVVALETLAYDKD